MAHVLLALACLVWLRLPAALVLGVHPATKPLKFAASIAAFLITMAILLPALTLGAELRLALSAALSLSMIAEMAVIGGQALRGKRSHFNLETPFDAALTSSMLVGIAVLLLAMLSVTVVATFRPIHAEPLLAMAWRAALWLFLFAAISGFGMGGRGRHTIGGTDGGPGLPLTNWSTTHGDLRVSHFFALHSLQIIPGAAWVLASLPLGGGVRAIVLGLVVIVNALLAGSTLLQAFASRPVW